ncbi:MAG: DUF3709 domain-containing protein [Chlorogloeopsis fritschii C42_A2020_084]|nr:DUF3709 domain-containing protein [Chlorogloeopsis fritschii C42_A2020_084]
MLVVCMRKYQNYCLMELSFF